MNLSIIKKTFFYIFLLIRKNNILHSTIIRIPQFRYRYEKILLMYVKSYPEKEVEVKVINGIKMLLSVKDWVQQNLFIYKCYEFVETSFWLNFTKNKQVVFDIGANVGYFSLLASKNISQKNGKIYSFEPITHTFNRAKYNIELNKWKNIILSKIAISNKIGTIEINVGNEENWGMSSINYHEYLSESSEIVNTQTLDRFIYEQNISKLDIVKIDVEGCELLVLEGMRDTIRKYRPTILIEVLDVNLNKASATKEDIFNFLWNEEYTAYKIIDGKTLEPINTALSFDGLLCFHPNDVEFGLDFKIVK